MDHLAPDTGQAVQFENHIAEAKKHYADAMSTASETLKSAMLCGRELLLARDVFTHGDWLSALKRYWPEIKRSTAYNYIRLAENSKLLGNLETTAEAYQKLGIMPTAPVETDTTNTDPRPVVITVEAVERWGHKIEARKGDVLTWPMEKRQKLKEALRPVAELYSTLMRDSSTITVDSAQ